MAKFDFPIRSGVWCNPKQCKNCNEWYDYCMCNKDSATAKFCEECIDNDLVYDEEELGHG